VSGTLLALASLFTGPVVAVARRECKLCVSTYTGPTRIAAASPAHARPDRDSGLLFTVSTANATNWFSRVGVPTGSPTIECSAWPRGDGSGPVIEGIARTPKTESVVVEAMAAAETQTPYKCLQAIAEPPRNIWIALPIEQVLNPEFNAMQRTLSKSRSSASAEGHRSSLTNRSAIPYRCEYRHRIVGSLRNVRTGARAGIVAKEVIGYNGSRDQSEDQTPD
jgi:hypothetical protein